MSNKASASSSKSIQSLGSKSIHVAGHNGEFFLEQLDSGVSGTIVVMICRMWDVNAVSGRYLSTDFVVSDAKGKVMHCFARSNIAHNFVGLKEGGVYSIKNFIVQPNKDEYRIIRQDPFILEFDGSTIIRKVSVNPKAFVRYPFELADFDEIEPTDNKYLIDVAGYVTNVGRTIIQKSGSRTLDFYLANNRGQSMRVTLWGGLGDILIEKKTKHVDQCPVVITSLNAKLYNNKVYLSSSSSTLIYDNEDIPALIDLKAEMRTVELGKAIVPADSSEPTDGSLENLLIWGRNKKNNPMTYNCTVMIDNVRSRKGWNYPSCGDNKCKKGATRKDGRFWCDVCKKHIDYPVLRYRVEVDVSDHTAQTVIVLFDEVVRNLLNCSPESLLSSDNEAQGFNLPKAITNLIGTSHTFELKTSSYFEHGTFESFTCWNVTRAHGALTCSSTPQREGKPTSPLMTELSKKSLSKDPSMSTPIQNLEGKKQKRMEYEDSDKELPHDDQDWSVDGSASKNKKRLRYVMTESDSEEEEVSPKAKPVKENKMNDDALINEETAKSVKENEIDDEESINDETTS